MSEIKEYMFIGTLPSLSTKLAGIIGPIKLKKYNFLIKIQYH